MTLPGVDALGHPDPAGLKAAGKVFVGQYLKAVSRSRIDAYHAAGISVVLIAEVDGRGSLGGATRGAAQARDAMVKAAALGAPLSTAIYLAEVDFDATTAQLPTIIDYYRAAQTILGTRLGGYGGYGAIKALFDAKVITYGMQTYGWSRDPVTRLTHWDRRVHIRQTLNGQTLAGATVDLDTAMTANYGAWAPGPAPKPPIPAPVLEDDEMKAVISEWKDPSAPDAKYLVDMAANTRRWLSKGTETVAVKAGAVAAQLPPDFMASTTLVGPVPHA